MIRKIIIIFTTLLIIYTSIYASDEISLEDFVKEMKIYSGDIIDVEKDANSLVEGKGLNKKNILINISNLFIKEIKNSIKYTYIMFVIIILTSIIKNISLDLDESVKKISMLSFILMISLLSITIFLDILKIFKSSITIFITSFQIAIPFLMALLVITGKRTTTSLIGTSILFVIQCIGFIVESIVIPFSILSLVFTIISGINQNINFNGIVKVFNKTSLTCLSIVFGIFLFFLALETNITVSVDGIYEKTLHSTATLVPVVGKFLSESIEGILGSFVLIKKVSGTITILILLQIMLIPIIKIVCIIFVFNILIIFTQIVVSEEKKIIDILQKFLDTYKFLLGVLISISGLSIISIGIIINIGSSIKM